MSEEILKPIPYLEYSLMNHPEWFFYERAFFTSGKNEGEVVKERDILPHRDTFGDRAKIWKKNHDVARNIIEVPAQETWCEIRNVGSDSDGKCMNGNIVLRPWRCAPHSSADAKVTKPVTDKPVLRMLNMVIGGHNAYRKESEPGVYVAILIGTGTPYIRWSLEMLDTASLPSRDYYSRPLLGYFFVPNKTKVKGAPAWKKNPRVTKKFFNAALLSLDKLRIARVFRFIQYRLVIVPFQSNSDAKKWTVGVKKGTAWIGDTTHSSPPVPWFHGEGYQAIPQDFIDQLKTDKTSSLLFPHPLVKAKEKTAIPKGIRHLAMYFPTFVYHLTEAAAKRGKAGSVLTLFDAEISFQMARHSFEARPQEQSLPDSLRSDIVAISRDKKGRIDAVFRGKKAAVGGPRDQEDLELYRKHPVGKSAKMIFKGTGKVGPKKDPRQKAPPKKPAFQEKPDKARILRDAREKLIGLGGFLEEHHRKQLDVMLRRKVTSDVLRRFLAIRDQYRLDDHRRSRLNHLKDDLESLFRLELSELILLQVKNKKQKDCGGAGNCALYSLWHQAGERGNKDDFSKSLRKAAAQYAKKNIHEFIDWDSAALVCESIRIAIREDERYSWGEKVHKALRRIEEQQQPAPVPEEQLRTLIPAYMKYCEANGTWVDMFFLEVVARIYRKNRWYSFVAVWDGRPPEYSLKMVAPLMHDHDHSIPNIALCLYYIRGGHYQSFE